jgi:16S rRNA (uracil1498-N3)-methyltransferase
VEGLGYQTTIFITFSREDHFAAGLLSMLNLQDHQTRLRIRVHLLHAALNEIEGLIVQMLSNYSLKSGSRFYVQERLNHVGQRIGLTKNIAQHAFQVLRLADGDKVSLFDGHGAEFVAVLQRGVKSSYAILEESIDSGADSKLNITLVQSVLTADKMDLVIQKATELGVTSLAPILTSRTVVKLNEKKIESRLEHWKNISIASSEQCGRSILPLISTPLSIEEWLSEIDPSLQKNEKRFVLAPRSGGKLPLDINGVEKVIFLIGPEGGLSDGEITLSETRGFQRTTIGPRVLRTETAGIVGASIAQAIWGDV